MSDTQQELSREDLLRIVNRDRFVKEQLSNRVATLVQENLELVSIVQELQGELQQAREHHASEHNGDVTTPVVPDDVFS